MSASTCPFCDQLAAPGGESAADIVWRFPNSVALLGTWQFYQGYCVLVSRRHATELHHLHESERRAFLEEMCLLARAVEECFHPHKLNYELLGNLVPHLHWHLFPRYARDPDAKKPVWLAIERAEHDEDLRRRLQAGTASRAETVATLKNHLQHRGAPIA